MSEPEIVVPSSCPNCGARLRPTARFCPSCGIAVKPSGVPENMGSPPPPPSVEMEQSASAEPLPFSAPQATKEAGPPSPQEAAGVEEQTPGYKLTLERVPPPARSRVILALRQTLGLSPQDAGLYVANAPVLLAVGLTPEMAEMLQKSLSNAGAQISVEEPPPPALPARPSEPAPEPRRRMAKVADTLMKIEPRAALRTVTGLDIGNTHTYLAFARAYGNKLVTAPEMVRFDAQTALPTAIQPARLGFPMTFGQTALKEWIKDPASVWDRLLEKIGEDDQVLPVIQRFLEVLASRLVEVLTPSALSIADGAATTLGVPADWDQGRVERLMHSATQAGFPIHRLAPRPLAALACHLQQGTLKQGPGAEKTMVIDWGGSSLALSFIEHGPALPKPQVFEHIEHPLGGEWFDNLLYAHIAGQITSELSAADQRELRLFSRKFKEQMSHAFAEGKHVYTQYCIIPAGSAPLRISIDQAEFEGMISEARNRFIHALQEAVQAVDLQPMHLDHLILAGGGARWYFARQDIRDTLGQVPLIGSHPEEVFARGLAVFRLEYNPAT